MVQLQSFYDEFVGDASTTRTMQLNNKLQKHFSERLKFVKSSYISHKRISEYVLSANDELVSDCINSSILGEGIPKAVRISLPNQ